MANSPKYHKMTEEVYKAIANYGNPFNVQSRVDTAIRSYLEACAEKLRDLYDESDGVEEYNKKLNSILGLGDVEAKSCCCGAPDNSTVVHRKDNPCYVEHSKSLTKQERLAQYLYHSFTENINGDLFDTERALQAHYMELAGKVLGWVEENN